MININKYIKEILKFEDCVIIQGLGEFHAQYKSAEVRTKEGTIAPPTKIISFNDKKKTDNGRLLNFIKNTESIPEGEIKQAIDTFSASTLNKLDEGQHVRVDELGYLYKDKAYKIQFVQDASENILLDAYGMEEFEWEAKKNINKKEIKDLTKQENSKSKKLIIPIALLVVVILVLSILISDKIEKSQGTPATKSLIGNLFSHKNADEQKEIIIQNIDSITEKTNALHYEEDKYSSFTKFYIVAGSFSIYNNAELYKNKLVAQGFNAEVLEVDGKIFRVSTNVYTDRNEALQELKRLQGRFKDNTLWVLNAR